MENKSKQTLFKAGLLAAAAGLLFFNEQKWKNRLEQERNDLETQKEVLLQKIDNLKKRDTSFRFYEHFANGADYQTLKAIEQETFVRQRENIYAQYRPKKLSAEMIEKNDTILKKRLHDSELFKQREQALEAFQASDSTQSILENGNIYLQTTLNLMSKHNKAMGGSLTRILENSDEVNEREFKARYFMFELKTKNKMYSSPNDLTADFYKMIFIKNALLYKQTAKQLTALCDSLDNQYNQEIKGDSLRFIRNKRRKIDSLLHAKPKTAAPHFEAAGLRTPFFPRQQVR